MKCERCNKETKGYELWDYCANCSKNLCSNCMYKGCCGHEPAQSGNELEEKNDSEYYGGKR